MLRRLLRPKAARRGPVGVFFDIENCTPPRWVSAVKLLMTLRTITNPHGPLKFVRLYQDSNNKNSSAGFRGFVEKASLCGFDIRDCPHNGEKEMSDRHIMTDMAAFVLDNPAPATVVLMSSDHDFAPMLNMLRNRNYTVVLVEGPRHSKPGMRVAADEVYAFEDVMARAHIIAVPDSPEFEAVKTVPLSLLDRLRRRLSDILDSSLALRPVTDRPYWATPSHTLSQDQPQSRWSTVRIPTSHGGSASDQAIFYPLFAALTMPEFRRPYISQLNVSRAILQRDPSAFARAGTKTYAEYFRLAQARGLVVLGVNETNKFEWMTLDPSLQPLVSDFSYDPVEPVNGSPSSAAVVARKDGHTTLKLDGRTHAPTYYRLVKLRARLALRRAAGGHKHLHQQRAQALTGFLSFLDGPAPTGRASEGRIAAQPEGAAETSVDPKDVPRASSQAEPSAAPVPSAGAFTRNPPLLPVRPALFAPLTALLRRPHTQATIRHSLNPAAYARAGAGDWAEYVQHAKAAGVVELGLNEADSDLWIRLTPTAARLCGGGKAGQNEDDPHPFAPLTAVLRRPHLQDKIRLLLARGSGERAALQAVGARDWREYVELAEVSGVVELGWGGGKKDRWIRLADGLDEQDGETSPSWPTDAHKTQSSLDAPLCTPSDKSVNKLKPALRRSHLSSLPVDFVTRTLDQPTSPQQPDLR